MRWSGFALVIALLVGFVGGCTDHEPQVDRFVPLTQADSSVEGNWVIKIDPVSCPILDGFLDARDGDETFDVFQDGDQLSASFTDSAGNSVVFEGTFDPPNVTGKFTITEASPATPAGTGDTRCLDSKAYIANFSPTITVVDMETRNVVATIPLESPAARLACSRDGRRLYAPIPLLGEIWVIDTLQDQLITILRGDTEHPTPHPMACTPSADGNTLYVVNYNSVIPSVSDFTIVTQFDVAGNNPSSWSAQNSVDLAGYGGSDIALSNDGSRLWVANYETGSIEFIDVASFTAGMQFGMDMRPISLDIGQRSSAGNNAEIVVVTGDGATVEVNQATGQIEDYHNFSGFDVVAGDGPMAWVSRTPGNGVGSKALLTGTVNAPIVTRFEYDTTEMEDLFWFDTTVPVFGALGLDLCATELLGITLPYFETELESNTIVGGPLTYFTPINTMSIDDTDPNLSGLFVKIVRPQAVVFEPRVICIVIEGIAQTHPEGQMIDGNFQITQDNSEFASQCVDQVQAYWIFQTFFDD